MTTLFDDKTACSVCGIEHDVTSIGSTNAFGSTDLDTRPPEMERSTILYWIQNCTACGYCAPQISLKNKNISEFLDSQEYKEQLDNPSFPDLANHFLCWSLICREKEKFNDAFWASIYAAWICDDSGTKKGAIYSRLNAIHYIQEAKRHEQPVSNQVGVAEAIEADLLRRANKFDEALLVIKKGLSLKLDDLLTTIFSFQESLVLAKNNSGYTLEDAQKYCLQTIKVNCH